MSEGGQERDGWDGRIEADSASGKLDFLMAEASRELSEGGMRGARLLATTRFWRGFDRLPEDVQRAAEERFEAIKTGADPSGPRLGEAGRFRTARIGVEHRALAVEDDGCLIRVWIGGPGEYAGMIEAAGERSH